MLPALSFFSIDALFKEIRRPEIICDKLNLSAVFNILFIVLNRPQNKVKMIESEY